MNFNVNKNTPFNHSNSPGIQYDQDRCSSFSNRPQLMQEGQQYEQQRNGKQKRKSRGNRKLQRFRQKLRRQGMDSHSRIDLEQSKTDEVSTKNERIIKPSVNERTFDSIKRNKKEGTRNISEQQITIKKQQSKSNASVSNNILEDLTTINDLVDCTTIPDEIVSQISTTAWNEIETLSSFLNENEKTKVIHHYISLIDRLSYVQLQEVQWKYYHEIGMTQNIWKGRMSKHLAEKYSICHTYGRSKVLIEQRLKQIEQHLQQANNAVEQFEQELLSKCLQNHVCFSTIKKLSTMIHQFVHEKQQPLQDQLQYKRKLLMLDATDHQLLQQFLNGKPNKSHVRRYRIVYITRFHVFLGFNVL